MAKLGDPIFEEKFLEQIDKGSPISTACDACGISRSTYTNWRNKAEKGDEKAISFIGRVNRRKAILEGKLSGMLVENAFQGDVNTAKWLLPRLNKEEWSKTSNVNLNEDNRREFVFVTKEPKREGINNDSRMESDSKTD